MKKSLFILACTVATFSMSAQLSVVKEAEKAMKGGKTYTEVNKIILPAQTNAETAEDAAVFYIPGKAAFNQYDKMLGLRQLHQLKNANDTITMGLLLLDGFENFKKALPLDSKPDAKGKIKPKYTKDMQNVLVGHLNDLTSEGANLYNHGKYKDAYKSWMTFIDVEENPDAYGVKHETVYPDSVVANFIMNAGLAAYQDGDLELAAKTFKRAAEKGYDKESFFKNGLSIAIQAKDPEIIYYFASKGNEKYGKTDPFYINNLINYFLENQKYDEALQYLENAAAENPDNAQYYVLEGMILDEKGDVEKAAEFYKKALSIEPTNGLANFQYGRSIYMLADKKDNDYSGSPAQYQAFKDSEIVPLYLDAIKYMEEAYKYDEFNRSKALTILEFLYYNTNNEEGMESVKQRKLDD